MKKLIEELEAAQNEIATDFDSSDYDCGMTDGFHAALEIVRAHNPWHEVAELPPPFEQSPDRSIEVLVLSEDGNIYTGVYDYKMKAFCILTRRTIAKDTHWSYLPEAKP